MIGHLGSRVTLLLDGRMGPAEEERAWEHVHTCPSCRDAVEREGWVKTQLARWSASSAPSSDGLRDALLARTPVLAPAATRVPAAVMPQPALAGAAVGRAATRPWAGVTGVLPAAGSSRTRHAVALGGSALGMAVMGVIALGTAPANAPLPDRRGATTSIVPPAPAVEKRPQQTSGRSSTTVSVRLRPAQATMVQ